MQYCPPHRLDRLVSGVLILARSSSAASLLQKLMRKNFVEKEYLARVKVIDAWEGVVNPIPRLCCDMGMRPVSSHHAFESCKNVTASKSN